MSKSRNTSAPPPFEMFVTMSREDAPCLYDDLASLPKGRRRINRLRFLANQGLMGEMLSKFLGGRDVPERLAGSSPNSSTNLSELIRAMNFSMDEQAEDE